MTLIWISHCWFIGLKNGPFSLSQIVISTIWGKQSSKHFDVISVYLVDLAKGGRNPQIPMSFKRVQCASTPPLRSKNQTLIENRIRTFYKLRKYRQKNITVSYSGTLSHFICLCCTEIYVRLKTNEPGYQTSTFPQISAYSCRRSCAQGALTCNIVEVMISATLFSSAARLAMKKGEKY